MCVQFRSGIHRLLLPLLNPDSASRFPCYPECMTLTLIQFVKPVMSLSVSLSVAASQLGERIVRGRRAYLVYRRRYGYHA